MKWLNLRQLLVWKRSYKRKIKQRREQGVQERERYIKEQHDKTDDKLFKLQQLLEVNPKAKRKELAEKLGVHPTYITKLKKQL
jgi:hypothetical protein